MVSLDKATRLPDFMIALKSIFAELGESFNKHATVENLVRHMDKNKRANAKEVVQVFIRLGYLRHHRNDTFSWTAAGLEYTKKLLSNRENSF